MSRVNPHFKVHTSIANHRKMLAVYADSKLLAMWVRLGIASIERFAAHTGDSFLVHERELRTFAGTDRGDSAVRLLHNLCAQSPMKCEQVGHNWSITFPNLQRKQGFGPNNGDSASAPHTHTHTHTHKETSAHAAQAWIQAQEAAKGYGIKWGKMTPARSKLVLARAAEHPEIGADLIAQAIHGYVTLRKSADFDWKAYLTPNTLLRASKFPTYLDAYREPQPQAAMKEPPAEYARALMAPHKRRKK